MKTNRFTTMEWMQIAHALEIAATAYRVRSREELVKARENKRVHLAGGVPSRIAEILDLEAETFVGLYETIREERFPLSGPDEPPRNPHSYGYKVPEQDETTEVEG